MIEHTNLHIIAFLHKAKKNSRQSSVFKQNR